jgi:hypothetical protein
MIQTQSTKASPERMHAAAAALVGSLTAKQRFRITQHST